MGVSKTGYLSRKGWCRRLALLLTVTLTSGNLGVIAPRAETLKQDKPIISGTGDLLESVSSQQISSKTSKKELSVPETLEMYTVPHRLMPSR